MVLRLKARESRSLPGLPSPFLILYLAEALAKADQTYL